MNTVTAAHVRRAALAAAPIATAAAVILGGLADPDPSGQGLDLVRTYTDNWDRVQWKSTSYHYGYMFLGATALGLASLVRSGRGVRFALGAGVLALLATATLPGMLLADVYASAGGGVVGPEKMREIEQAAQGGWSGAATIFPGMLGFVLCLPLATIAAVRAGLLRWHVPLVAIAAFVAMMALAGNVAGTVVVAALFAVLGHAIIRIPVAAFGGRPGVEIAAASRWARTAEPGGEPDAPRIAV